MSENNFWKRFAETTNAADAAEVARADQGKKTSIMTEQAEQAAQKHANQTIAEAIRREAERRGLVWDPLSNTWIPKFPWSEGYG